MKVLLASPTYGPVNPLCVQAIRGAVMVAGNAGILWAGEASADRMSYTDARNYTAQILMDDFPAETDGVMWVDSDIRPQPDSILKLLRTAEHNSFDFLSGVYHQRRGEYRPCFYGWDERCKGYRQNLMYEEDTIVKAGSCGFGFVYTSRRMFRDIEMLPKFSRDRGGWFPDHHYGDVGEDMGFCLYARDAGYTLYVHTGIQVDHEGETRWINRQSYLTKLMEKTQDRQAAQVSMG
jgi:GT2 family glycosyltransferase